MLPITFPRGAGRPKSARSCLAWYSCRFMNPEIIYHLAVPAPAAPRTIAPVSAPRRPGIPGALPGCWFVLVALNYVTDPLHWKRMVLTLDAARLWFEAPFTVSQQLRVLPDHLAAGAAALACLAAGFLAGGGPAVWFGTGDRPLRLALGLGSASLIQLGLGLTGLLVPWIMWPAAALLALAGGR